MVSLQPLQFVGFLVIRVQTRNNCMADILLGRKWDQNWKEKSFFERILNKAQQSVGYAWRKLIANHSLAFQLISDEHCPPWYENMYKRWMGQVYMDQFSPSRYHPYYGYKFARCRDPKNPFDGLNICQLHPIVATIVVNRDSCSLDFRLPTELGGSNRLVQMLTLCLSLHMLL